MKKGMTSVPGSVAVLVLVFGGMSWSGMGLVWVWYSSYCRVGSVVLAGQVV
jgi:hypothetical protein